MGKSYSRSVENKGDAQVNVYNALEAHSEAHEGHELKLWTIIVLLGILFAISLHREYTRRVKKRAIVTARSVAWLDEVWKPPYNEQQATNEW